MQIKLVIYTSKNGKEEQENGKLFSLKFKFIIGDGGSMHEFIEAM